MFIGTYEHSIDDKSRLTLPRRFRDALGAGVVLARGLDRNVAVYPRETWKVSVEDRVSALDPAVARGAGAPHVLLLGGGRSRSGRAGSRPRPGRPHAPRRPRARRGRGRELRPPPALEPNRLGAAPACRRRERRTCCRTSCRTRALTTSPFSRRRCASSSPCGRGRRSSTRPSALAATRALLAQDLAGQREARRDRPRSGCEVLLRPLQGAPPASRSDSCAATSPIVLTQLAANSVERRCRCCSTSASRRCRSTGRSEASRTRRTRRSTCGWTRPRRRPPPRS